MHPNRRRKEGGEVGYQVHDHRAEGGREGESGRVVGGEMVNAMRKEVEDVPVGGVGINMEDKSVKNVFNDAPREETNEERNEGMKWGDELQGVLHLIVDERRPHEEDVIPWPPGEILKQVVKDDDLL